MMELRYEPSQSYARHTLAVLLHEFLKLEITLEGHLVNWKDRVGRPAA